MELSGDRIINAPQERVYDALHDPVTLRQVLPGCQSLATTAGGKSQISSLVKVGPIRATVATTVEVFNEDRPAGYSLYAIANAANAGSGAGTAHVALAAVDEETTNLAYHISADLDGRIAELGEDVLEDTARTLIAEFFSRLKLLLESPQAEHALETPETADEAPKLAAVPTGEPKPPSRPRQSTAPNGRAARPETPASTRMVLGQQVDEEARGNNHGRPAEEAVDVDGTTTTAGDAYQPPFDPAPEHAATEREPSPAAPREGRRTEPAPPREGMSNTRRWLLVALGIAVIAYLLSDGL